MMELVTSRMIPCPAAVYAGEDAHVVSGTVTKCLSHDMQKTSQVIQYTFSAEETLSSSLNLNPK